MSLSQHVRANTEAVIQSRFEKWVDLSRSKEFKFDIVYASPDNFFGKAVYEFPAAFLKKNVAEDLRRAAGELAKSNKGIIVYDAYRPWSITKLFYEHSPENVRQYLANPDSGSAHNKGCAVDIGLFDLDTGHVSPMPSGFDEMSERAHWVYQSPVELENRNRDLLRQAMTGNGFTTITNEWWHYNHKTSPTESCIDADFEMMSDFLGNTLRIK